MKTITIQQEILLITSSNLCKEEWCVKDENYSIPVSFSQRVEEACCNGLLDEMLPEIIERTSSGKRLYLWHIRHGHSFVQIELAEFPLIPEREFSIDPEIFLARTMHN